MFHLLVILTYYIVLYVPFFFVPLLPSNDYSAVMIGYKFSVCSTENSHRNVNLFDSIFLPTSSSVFELKFVAVYIKHIISS